MSLLLLQRSERTRLNCRMKKKAKLARSVAF